MFINWKERQLNVNLVYYGAALCGKTTNLEQIHKRMSTGVRSELFTLNTHEDRTIFFDFMQLTVGTIGGLKPKFGLYTVPGQSYYEATRAAVLRRADGVVFVVDSQPERLEENRHSWQDLQRHLLPLGGIQNIPCVIQYNKRDLPNCLPVEVLASELQLANYAAHEASALSGVGVRETLQTGMKLVLAHVQRQLAQQVSSSHQPR